MPDDFSTFHCPRCKAEVRRGSREFPFCSKRCRYVDLGAWLEEKYRIPSAPSEDDLDLEEDSAGEGPTGSPDPDDDA